MSPTRSQGRQEYLAGLAQLHQAAGAEARRAIWRQGLASLAAAASARQPTPLEGLPPESLRDGVRAAMETGLLDDIDFLARNEAVTALFELAAALPPGPEKRELMRRVFAAMNQGDGATFVTLATSLALAAPWALAGPGIRARVALALCLPLGTGVNADALALALISRRELERDWVSGPSMGPLPARRLAARLLERGAREAVRRADGGDESGLRVFERPQVRAAWARLLADRESLVWRHVAAARGLLAGAVPELAAELERDLNPRLGPTEWRRAAASLTASVAHAPLVAAERTRALLAGELFRRDPGITAAMVFGLCRAAEEAPEEAEALLQELVRVGGVDAFEALVELRQELGGAAGQKAAATALGKLRSAAEAADDGLAALMQALDAELAPPPGSQGEGLRAKIRHALLGFAEGRALASRTEEALLAAEELLVALERFDDESEPEARRMAFRALRDLDTTLLESSTLADLLTVSPALRESPIEPFGALLGRLNTWILAHERRTATGDTVPHLTLRLRRLRALLHLLDVESAGEEEHARELRERRLVTLRVLLGRVRANPPAALRRTLCAALARGCDALVRDDVLELSDVFVALCWNISRAEDLDVLAEASMIPEMKAMLHAGAEAMRALTAREAGDKSLVEAVQGLAEAVPAGASVRTEGLRLALLGVARAFGAAAAARSLRGLRGLRGTGGPSVLERLGEALERLARLVAGVHRRLDPAAKVPAPRGAAALEAVETAVDRVSRDLDDDVAGAVKGAEKVLRSELPALLAEIAAALLAGIPKLPLDAPAGDDPPAASPSRALRLPSWLPPSRQLGGFYVVRPIGAGAGGSVFVARRVEHRHDEGAETYALKVPSYNGQAAHTLSEEEFLQLFREEAGALLTLPKHRNLAGFVTFDAGARPKPILVMELVTGPTLERLIDRRALGTRLALAVLDGIAAGLEAMHSVGVAHLDVKPANIILRYAEGGSVSLLVRAESVVPLPVLVDFGLAGRRVRPGCASPYYGGPEIWDPDSFRGQALDPRATDVYAFCCLAYELFTGRTLFDGETLPALVTSHLTHDGGPAALARLRTQPALAPFVDLLTTGLLRSPRRRVSIAEVRTGLSRLGPTLSRLPWPVEG